MQWQFSSQSSRAVVAAASVLYVFGAGTSMLCLAMYVFVASRLDMPEQHVPSVQQTVRSKRMHTLRGRVAVAWQLLQLAAGRQSTRSAMCLQHLDQRSLLDCDTTCRWVALLRVC
jgi:hypothetical protein